MASAKENAFLNAAYQVLRLIFPIITYPYVSRVLGPTGLGQVAFAQKIADYFCMTALLGIPMYGLREISRVRHDQDQLSRVFSELLILSAGTSLAAFAVYAALPLFAPRLTAGPSLHWVFAMMIIVNPGRLDWFYQGLERYRYVTLRSLLVRLGTAAMIFVVVRDASHFVNYGALWVAGSVITGIWNFVYSLRLTRLTLRAIKPLRHFRHILPTIGIQLVGTLASVIDITMLGILIDDNRYSVGLYSVASRIIRIALSLIVAGISVVMPRVSASFARGDRAKTESLIAKSFAYSLFFTLPMVVGLVVLADDIVLLFAGDSFAPAITTLRILAPQLLVFALGNVVNMQVFYAQGREKSVFVLSMLATVLGIGANVILIPRFLHDGAAIATLAVSSIGLLVQSSLAARTILRLLVTRENGRIIALIVIWSLALLLGERGLDEWTTVWRMLVLVPGSVLLYGATSLWIRLLPARELFDWVTRGRKRKEE
jgi:O-antigen/teichoic acid export membrane protein